MKIAVLGSGGREHAIAWKFGTEIGSDNVFVLPGNGGTNNNIDMESNNFELIKSFCSQNEIDLLFVGPETPLSAGITDYFRGSATRVFGPTRAAARLESSKIFAKCFMHTHGVRTADYWVCEVWDDANSIVEELGGEMVIKYDGLAGGKGVFVSFSMQEARLDLETFAANFGYDCRFLIERKLNGYELSLIGITDGQSIKLFPPSQDHKQLLDGDKGPNTGGMGAYCPFPVSDGLMQQIMETIVTPTLQGLQRENLEYKGIIYFGIMVCADGPYLLEYNARFGDPETEVLLPAMQSSLTEAVLACLDGRLAAYEMVFNDRYWVDVVLAVEGYPRDYKTNLPIKIKQPLDPDTLVFHAGTMLGTDGQILTTGGRVLNVVASGHSLNEAIERVYAECAKIEFEGIYYRRDIAQRKKPI